jgi:carbon storage regulator
MLILSRRRHERIMIGPDIIISVESINCESVRIGVEAPKAVAVDREEIRQSKDRDARERAAWEAEKAQRRGVGS